jgi:uncharacterized protein (DUF342 family)
MDPRLEEMHPADSRVLQLADIERTEERITEVIEQEEVRAEKLSSRLRAVRKRHARMKEHDWYAGSRAETETLQEQDDLQEDIFQCRRKLKRAVRAIAELQRAQDRMDAESLSDGEMHDDMNFRRDLATTPTH